MAEDLRIYLIRHGETEWSVTGQHTGRTDIPLTPHGEDEARSLEPILAKMSFTHVFSSPRMRARRTFELAGLASKAVIEPDLSEWDYGEYEGKRSDEIFKARPGWNVFRDGCPNGETPQQVSDRADRLIEHCRSLSGHVALFSHGQFGASLAARWIGLPILSAEHFYIGTATINILGYHPRHIELPVILAWNIGPLALT